ncbi:MAG TPA: MATE family efflux transporter [Gemmatimonadota bacterium]|nr:MATE family efflux transporter [Gemmatimonadota bacterium]
MNAPRIVVVESSVHEVLMSDMERAIPVEPEAPARAGPFAVLKEAIRGSSQDYTQGPVGHALLMLAIPMVLETALESVFALTNIFWVSRLGAGAITSVGLTESIVTLVYTIAIGLSIGVTAMVARRIGGGDPEGAARSAVQAIGLGVGLSTAIGVSGILFAPQFLQLLGAEPEVVAEGSGYARVLLGGNATIMLLFLLNAVFRGAGDAAIAMRLLWLANAINIVLDPFLIFGIGPFPELGLTGAAVATTIGRGTAVVVQLVTLLRPRSRVRVRRIHMRLDAALLATLVRLSATGTFQVFVGMASWIALIRILAGYGTEVVAGYTIAIRVIIFALMPSWGLSNAAATMVGQGLGAGKPERAIRSVRLAGWWSALALGAVGVVFVALAPWIVALFTDEPATARWAVMGLRIVALGFPFYGWGMVLEQSFNGAGDTRTPTWINIACFWALELPAAWFLSRAGMGPMGVFVAIAVAYSAVPVIAGQAFKRGGWMSARA